MIVYSKQIKHRSDITGFFIHLLHDLQLNFHPDDRFDECLDPQTKEEFFSSNACTTYDKIMDDCHAWCAIHKQDIYQIALEANEFPKFLAGYARITKKKPMRRFVREFIDINYGVKGIVALHTYGGCYWIEEYLENGKPMFQCIIENTNPSADNLRDMEIVLFDWMTKDVPAVQKHPDPLPAYIRKRTDLLHFFAYLHNDRSVAFHPDDSFYDYIDVKTRTATFRPEESQRFDRLMNGAHRWCNAHGEDIYELGLETIAFLDSHIRLTKRHAIDAYFRDYVSSAYEISDDVVALHLYKPGYWIEEAIWGNKPFYQTAFGSVTQASTSLRELEIDLLHYRYLNM